MNFIKAAKAFLSLLLSRKECEHRYVNLFQNSTYCPDCGYRVKIEWMFLHCRKCNAKRVPTMGVLGWVRPVHQFCRHCGYEGFRIVKKSRIEAYELMYALSIKTVIYSSDEPDPPLPEVCKPFANPNVVVSESGDVFEAEIIRKREFRGTKSAFKAVPFEWQKNQSPKRYL